MDIGYFQKFKKDKSYLPTFKNRERSFKQTIKNNVYLHKLRNRQRSVGQIKK